MIKKSKIVFGVCVLMVLMGSFAGLPGCGTTSVGINPYEFLSRVDSVDHTQLFISAYQAFQLAGLSMGVGAEQAQAATSTSTSSLTAEQIQALSGHTTKTIR